MANSQKDNSSKVPDLWWLSKTSNPDGSLNPTVTAISNIYCIADFLGMNIDDIENQLGLSNNQSFKKILALTEAEWNDNSKPFSKKIMPGLPDGVLEKASKLFSVTEETLQQTPLSPEIYYYTYGNPTSPNVQAANEENMKLILFIEKIATDCRNYTFNVVRFTDGDPNHFGAKYDLESVDGTFSFSVSKNEIGSIVIVIGNVVGGALSFGKGDIVYPIAERMENIIHDSAARDAKCKKIAYISSDVLNIMSSFLNSDKSDNTESEKEIKEVNTERTPLKQNHDKGDDNSKRNMKQCNAEECVDDSCDCDNCANKCVG